MKEEKNALGSMAGHIRKLYIIIYSAAVARKTVEKKTKGKYISG